MKKLIGRIREHLKQSDYYDYNLLAATILLLCFGLVMLYSTSFYDAQITFEGNDMHYFSRQAIYGAFMIIGVIIISLVDYHILAPFSGWIYLLSLVLMVLVKFTPLGYGAYGAKRWLDLYVVKFQPAEVAKVALIIFIPLLVIKMGKQVKTAKAVTVLLIFGAVPAVAAWILTDNLSTAIIIAGIAVGMIFVAHPKTKIFLKIGAGLAALVTLLGVIMIPIYLKMDPADIKSFRLRRILAWIAPEQFPNDGGYQVKQALYAIGSGGFFGKGLGNSAQKLGTIPEAQNDMIFAIVCEELGIFGVIILLFLFGYVLYRLLFIAQNAPDLYGTLMVSGVFVHIALQVVLNLFVVVGWLPATGITLPFVSYGGTSVVFLLGEIGIALSVARKIPFNNKN